MRKFVLSKITSVTRQVVMTRLASFVRDRQPWAKLANFPLTQKIQSLLRFR